MLDPEESEQPAVLLGDPDFLVLANPGRDRHSRLGLHLRQIVHLVPRPDEQLRQRLDLVLTRRSDLHAS